MDKCCFNFLKMLLEFGIDVVVQLNVTVKNVYAKTVVQTLTPAM